MNRVLILSDDRMGHLNQSLAFVKTRGTSYDIVSIKFKYKWLKSLTYLLDRMGIKTTKLFSAKIDRKYDMVVGTGSTTAYAVKVLSKQLDAKSVVMMLPRGYKYDFDIIFAQSHDKPPKQKNIIEIPANFSYVEPKGLYEAKKKSVGVVIGGDNKLFTMSPQMIKAQLDYIVDEYTEHEIAITTSPRTSKVVEEVIESYIFEYEVIFSKNPINPIPDFLALCETVFITGDSTSMISEAISYGSSNVVVLPLRSQKANKFTRFVSALEKEEYLHVFDGTIINKNKKVDFKTYLKGLEL